MSTVEIIGFVLALLVMGVGVLGSILPGLPSTPLVLIAAVGHKLYFRETGVSWWIMTILVAITLFSLVVDYLASIYGAKRFGATRTGMIGAIVGAIVGLFFNLPGILLGPFVGAAIFEMVGGRKWKEASWAGLGATIGLFAGALGKIACCGVMIVLFLANVLWRTFQN